MLSRVDLTEAVGVVVDLEVGARVVVGVDSEVVDSVEEAQVASGKIEREKVNTLLCIISVVEL